MATSIQRQSILSTLVIYIGFAFGAVNLWLLQKLIGADYYGLTKVVNDFSFIAAYFATLGSQALVAKFFPFYKYYLPKEKNDLSFIAIILAVTGTVITVTALLLLKAQIIVVFGRENPLFINYYWTIIPFTILLMAFLFFEPFAWHAGKTVYSNLLKETFIRVLTTVMVCLLLFKLIDPDWFVKLYAFIYLIPVVAGYVLLIKWKAIPVYPKLTKVTFRLKKRLIGFSSFLFLTTIFNIGSQVCDTLFLGSMKGFDNATQFAIAQYFGSVLEVPNRAIMGSSIPVLAEFWRTKDLAGIQRIYKKSAMNLMIAGIFFGGLIIINLPNAIDFLFDPSYMIIIIPAVIIIFSKIIDLSTGLNAQVILTSNLWKFDFYSTLIYSLVAIPLNFFLIRTWGIYGAAVANVMANLIKNGIRWWYLYHKFRLQPFTFKNLELLLASATLITAIWFLPFVKNVFIDTPVRTIVFLVGFAVLILSRNYSAEVNSLWVKYKDLAVQKLRVR